MAIEGLTLRLYLDHNVQLDLAAVLRRHGFDAVHAREVGMAGAADPAHLSWATAQGRTVFTYDRVDFALLDEEWLVAGRSHAGIVVSIAPPRLPFRLVVRRLLVFLDRVTTDEAVNRLFWLDDRWDEP